MNITIKPYLAAKGHSAEDVDNMHGPGANQSNSSWRFGSDHTRTPGGHRRSGDPATTPEAQKSAISNSASIRSSEPSCDPKQAILREHFLVQLLSENSNPC